MYSVYTVFTFSYFSYSFKFIYLLFFYYFQKTTLNEIPKCRNGQNVSVCRQTKNGSITKLTTIPLLLFFFDNYVFYPF